MICIQETKKEAIDKSLCQTLWGNADVTWEMQPANNSAGDILCMWSEIEFRLQNKVIGNGFIFLEGEWIKEAQRLKRRHFLHTFTIFFHSNIISSLY